MPKASLHKAAEHPPHSRRPSAAPTPREAASLPKKKTPKRKPKKSSQREQQPQDQHTEASSSASAATPAANAPAAAKPSVAAEDDSTSAWSLQAVASATTALHGLPPALLPEVRAPLTKLDDRLVEVLERGDIRLVRTAWLRAQPRGFLVLYRQQLELLEQEGASPSPLLSSSEAVALVRRGSRCVGVLSYGWLSPGNPDPAGVRLQVVLAALAELAHIEALFWDYASLFQNPPNGKRTKTESDAFSRALGVMGDLYASVIGTTVLQLKEIPPRPEEFDGAICLFDLKEGVDEAAVRGALGAFGEIVDYQAGGWPPVRVWFRTHAAALAAKAAVGQLTSICDGIDTLYNERSYDGRHGEENLADDGRGWCCFEGAVSSELVTRLSAYPKMRDSLDTLPPKLLALSSGKPAEPVNLDYEELGTRVERVVERIERATFVGKGDAEKVPQMYKDYVGRIATALQATLAHRGGSIFTEGASVELPLPAVAAPPAAPLRLAKGQLLLLLPDASGRREGGEGARRLGYVRNWVQDADCRALVFTQHDLDSKVGEVLGYPVVQVSFDGYSQAALPWRPPANGWELDVDGFNSAMEDVRKAAQHLSPDATTAAEMDSFADTVREVLTAECEQIQTREFHEVADKAERRIMRASEAAVRQLKSNEEARQEGTSTGGEAAASVRVLLEMVGEEPWAAMAMLGAPGAVGARRYAAGQALTVRIDGVWQDAEVEAECARDEVTAHRLRIAGCESTVSLALHPWNHAPRELPADAFEALRSWWAQSLRAQHGHIRDALSGNRLDTLEQCVAFQVTGVGGLRLADIGDVRGLSAWMCDAAPRGGEATATTPCAALLTGPPAAGKSTLISQLVTLALENIVLVPIVIQVQKLQARLLETPDTFAAAWNWFDAYLRRTEKPPIYRMLRQAMAARRALLLLDGLDEGGQVRAEIERHVVEVLAPQGHTLLVTSRPAGIVETRYASFRRLRLAPLSHAQQHATLKQRLGSAAAADEVLAYVEKRMPLGPLDRPGSIRDEHGREKLVEWLSQDQPLMRNPMELFFDGRTRLEVMAASAAHTYEVSTEVAAHVLRAYVNGEPLDPDAQNALRRVTANPLMLSMVASVFELRQGIGMPKTVADMYASASDSMLARGGVVSPKVSQLLQAVFFEAHAAQNRVIEDRQLDEAALGLERPEVLPAIRKAAANVPFEPFDVPPLRGRAEIGHYVEVLTGNHEGKRGVITEKEIVGYAKKHGPFRYTVTFVNGATTHFIGTADLIRKHLRSSGKDMETMLARGMAAQVEELRSACAQLSAEMRDALRIVRERVARDELPLLSLLQAEPLQMQSSHLSFQEYFAARALCEQGTVLYGKCAPPWNWTSWWDNTLSLGFEMGDNFRRGLLRAAGIEGDRLNLSGTLRSLSPTAPASPLGDGPTIWRVITEVMDVLSECNLLHNRFEVESATMLAKVGTEKRVMLSGIAHDQTEADFSSQRLKPCDAILIASDLRVSSSLVSLNLSSNQLFPIFSCKLDEIYQQWGTGLPPGLVSSLEVSPSSAVGAKMRIKDYCDELTVLNVSTYDTEDTEDTEDKRVEADRVQIGDPTGIQAIADALETNGVLEKLVLSGNRLNDKYGEFSIGESLNNKGLVAICESLKRNTSLKELELCDCNIGPEGGRAVASMLRINGALISLDLSNNVLRTKDSSTFEPYPVFEELADALLANGVLTKLVLSHNSFNDKGLIALCESLKRNTSLKELELCDCNICAEGCWTALASMLEINAVMTDLKLRENRNIWKSAERATGTADLFKALQSNKQTKLASLDLGVSSFRDHGSEIDVQPLAAATIDSLTTLDVSKNTIGAEGAESLAKALCANSCSFTELNLSDSKLCGIWWSDNLDEHGTYTAEGVTAFADALKVNRSLKSLDISENHIGVEGAKEIAKALCDNKMLTELNLSDNRLCGEFHDRLFTRTRIRRCGVGFDGIRGIYDASAITALAEALGANGVLRKIVLSNNVINQARQKDAFDAPVHTMGAIAICESLKHNTSLKELELCKCGIGAEGGKALASMLEANGVLDKLNVDGCELNIAELKGTDAVETLVLSGDLDEASGIVIAKCIASNPVLTNLKFGKQHIRDEGAKAIAEALSSGTPALTNLYYRGEEMEDEAAHQLAAAVLGSKTLKWYSMVPIKELREDKLAKLNLSQMRLGPPVAIVIAELIKGSQMLTYLNLESNSVGLEGAKSLAEALSSGASALKTLNIQHNSIEKEGIDALDEAVEGREGFELLKLLGNYWYTGAAGVLA